MKQAIENLVHKRTDDICKKINENEEFIECDRKEHELLEELENNISSEEKKIVSELNELVNYKTAICEEMMYKEGFKDGIKFIQEFVGSDENTGQIPDRLFRGAKRS